MYSMPTEAAAFAYDTHTQSARRMRTSSDIVRRRDAFRRLETNTRSQRSSQTALLHNAPAMHRSTANTITHAHSYAYKYTHTHTARLVGRHAFVRSVCARVRMFKRASGCLCGARCGVWFFVVGGVIALSVSQRVREPKVSVCVCVRSRFAVALGLHQHYYLTRLENASAVRVHIFELCVCVFFTPVKYMRVLLMVLSQKRAHTHTRRRTQSNHRDRIATMIEIAT